MIKYEIFKIDHRKFEEGQQKMKAWLKKHKNLKLEEIKILQSTRSGAMFDAETIITIFYEEKKKGKPGG